MKDKKQKNKKHPEASPEDVQELQKQLANLSEENKALKDEKDEIFAKLQRLSADYANYQKRAPKQIADSIAYEKEAMIKPLLAVLDNFEHTLGNGTTDTNADVILKGVQIVYDQMLDVLKSKGVEQISSLGEEFDPAQHQAMIRQSDPEKEEGVVLAEYQKGYKLNDRVIRPAKVAVNKIVEETEDKPEKEKAQDSNEEDSENQS